MKMFYKSLIIASILAASSASAGSQQEIHIYPSGEAHLIGAELFRKHAVNLFTVKSWEYRWLVPIDVTDTNIKFESAYGAPIELREMQEGHLLEIKGKHIYKNFEYSVEPTLIRDLNIKTGEPAPSSPQNLVSLQSTTPPPSNIQPPTSHPPKFKLTMTLKPGFWGGQVKILQEFLKKEGYFPQKEPTSRYFGSATKKALMEFQKANALEAVGALGPKTRALINSVLK